jgi:hypothetical protein
MAVRWLEWVKGEEGVKDEEVTRKQRVASTGNVW